MKLRGIVDIIDFLNVLDRQKVHYRIDKHRDDSLMVTFTTVGKRVELDFLDDHIEYSIFEGDESVHDDQVALFEIIASHV